MHQTGYKTSHMALFLGHNKQMILDEQLQPGYRYGFVLGEHTQARIRKEAELAQLRDKPRNVLQGRWAGGVSPRYS